MANIIPPKTKHIANNQNVAFISFLMGFIPNVMTDIITAEKSFKSVITMPKSSKNSSNDDNPPTIEPSKILNRVVSILEIVFTAKSIK